MGPRSDERGNSHAAREDETDDLPSMGPRSDERGNAERVHGRFFSDGPSMGPRSDERGNCVFRAMAESQGRTFNGAALG